MKKILVLIIICAFIQLLFMVWGSTSGGLVSEMDKKIEVLKKENQSLEQQIASNISFLAIVQRATQAGFVKTADFKLDASMALKR
ncbi:MAG TPA: hypothetical protein VMW25_01365 [Clostridia bacterium]|nr:hypothetical protein [Clostridia bacterium]